MNSLRGNNMDRDNRKKKIHGKSRAITQKRSKGITDAVPDVSETSSSATSIS
jgi:hypothetical protein